MSFRIGQGIDAHRFGAPRPLVLGGVTIPFDRGLEAHSDGDVVIHALCDALLGAATLGDIGGHFPDNDASYKNIDSRVLLRRVRDAIANAGWRVVNVDLTVVAQAPKLKPYAAQMQALLAQDLAIESGQINIKATTTERMGFTGRGEGIAAFAVCLIEALP